jgi:hypothetical protein
MTIADDQQKGLIQDIEVYTNVRLTRIDLNTEPFEKLQLPIKEKSYGGGGRFGQSSRFGGGSGGHSGPHRGSYSRSGSPEGKRGGRPGAKRGPSPLW